jgi:hypothetical protein
LDDSGFDLVQTADNLLARWDLVRRGKRSRAADKEFRVWLMRTMLELVDAISPDPDNEQAHCITVAATIGRCVTLGRLDDAFTLAQWLADAYVPRGDDLSHQTILGSAAFCSDAGQDPEVNERAIRLLRRVVDTVPRNSRTEMEQAVCKALMDLSNLYTIGRTSADGRHRTRASIDVCDEIIARWEASRDSWLQLTVAGAMLNKAMSLLEFGDELAARQQYARVIESYAADSYDGEIGHRVSIAQHALETLDTVRFPGPELKIGYFEAQIRRRLILRRSRFRARANARRHIRAANRLHRETADFVRHAACVGEPWVLLLRNFDLIETSVVTTSPPDWVGAEREPEVYGKAIYFTDGMGLINQLIEVANVVQVANTMAAALEIDIPTMSAQGRRRTPRLLYLPDADWLDTIRALISLAEHIVVWAHEKTPALLQELTLITELGRAKDTSVLLEKHQGRRFTFAGFDSLPPPSEDLSPEDPALAGFRVTVRAEDAKPDGAKPSNRYPIRALTTFGEAEDNPVLAEFLNIMHTEAPTRIHPEDSPFLREITRIITSAQMLSMEDRVARIRHRIDATRAQ